MISYNGSRVNYPFIFQADPSDQVYYNTVIRTGLFLMCLILVSATVTAIGGAYENYSIGCMLAVIVLYFSLPLHSGSLIRTMR